MRNKVGIVIVSYNASHAARITLAAVRQAKNVTPYTLILVDNASEFTERQEIQRAFNRHLQEQRLPWRYLQQEQNLGFSGGNNLGIRLLLKDEAITHICLLNSDVLVTDFWLDRLVEKGCDVVSPVTNKADSEQCVPIDYHLNLSNCLEDKSERLIPDLVAPVRLFAERWFCAWRGNLVEADVTFFCVLLSRDILCNVGLLDEGFFPGGYEDDDYCLRARAYGYRIYLARDVFVHHWGSASFGQLHFGYLSKQAIQNRQYLERKHHIEWKNRHETPYISFLTDLGYTVNTHDNFSLRKYFLELYVKKLRAMLLHIDSEFKKLCQILLNNQWPLPDALASSIPRMNSLDNLSEDWNANISRMEVWLEGSQPDETNGNDLLDQLHKIVTRIKEKIDLNLTMHSIVMSRFPSTTDRLLRLLSRLKRGVRFIWRLKGIVFFGGYPYPDRLSDGYFQRIQMVDRLFNDRWRIYVESNKLPQRDGWFDHPEPKVLVLRVSGTPRRQWLMKVLVLLAVLRCRAMYIHSVLRMRDTGVRALMRIPGIFRAIDIHGVVPEEFRLHNDFYSAVLFEARERLAVRSSDLIIVVSRAMENYLRQKYRSELRGRIAVFPMFPDLASTCSLRPYFDGKPIVIYAGGLQKWQQVDKMLDAIKRTASVYAYRIYCPAPDVVRKMLSEAVRSHVVIDCKTHRELTEIYVQCHYGFILRDDIVVNHVACPTKLVEYLATGIVPIVESENLGDFKAMGMRTIPLKQLLQGKLPDERERAEIARHNLTIYEKLGQVRKQGTHDIRNIVDNGWQSIHLLPSLPSLIALLKRALPVSTRRGRIARSFWRVLRSRAFSAESSIWSPVRKAIDVQIDASIPTECDVLLQVDNFEAGGLENVVLDLADTLQGSGLRVVLLVLGAAGAGVERAREHGIPIIIGSAESNLYRLCIDRAKPRLLLTHYSIHGVKLCHELGIPFVQVIHNTYMWLDDAQRAAFDQASRLTTVFVAVSEYAKDYSVRRLGIEESKCVVIPNGIDNRAFERMDKSEARRKFGKKHGVTDRDFIFLSVGAINHQKNHIATVKAFAAAAEEIPNAKLLIVGPTAENELLKEIEYFIRDRMFDKRIIYAGATSEVHQYYAMADAFVSAAFFEGGPLNQLEAAKANLPAVLTNVGFAPHFARQPGFEIIEPPFDIASFHGAIWQLTSTPEFEDRLAAAMINVYQTGKPPDLSPMVLEEFDKSNTYRRYIELIAAILHGKDFAQIDLSVSWPNKLSSLSQGMKTVSHAADGAGPGRTT